MIKRAAEEEKFETISPLTSKSYESGILLLLENDFFLSSYFQFHLFNFCFVNYTDHEVRKYPYLV